MLTKLPAAGDWGMELGKISIVIPCHESDRLKDVTELLDSVEAQTYRNIETIIATEGSFELTQSIRAYMNEKGYLNVQVLYNEAEPGSYPSQNLGIGQATGEIIAFVDDDALLFPGWAEEIAKTYADDSSVIGVTGPILPLWETDSVLWFPIEFYWIFSCTFWDWIDKKEVRNGYCTNLSFRREAFDACGLFMSRLEYRGSVKSDWQQPGAQETELCVRIKQKTGKRIIYDPNVKVKHKVYGYRISTRFIMKRAYLEGYAKAILNNLYRSPDTAVLSTEYKLLNQILFGLVPISLRLLFSQPIVALRRLWVTSLVLLFVAIGYCSSSIRGFAHRREIYGVNDE